jgi:hypothetical protein
MGFIDRKRAPQVYQIPSHLGLPFSIHVVVLLGTLITGTISCLPWVADPGSSDGTLQSPGSPRPPSLTQQVKDLCKGTEIQDLEPASLGGKKWAYRELPIKFGTEFEFPSRYGMDPENNTIPQKYQEYVTNTCKICGDFFTCTSKMEDAHEVIHITERASSLSIEISPTADQAVLELRTDPMTYGDYVKRARLLDVFVFKVTQAMQKDGLLISPLEEPNRWSGHMNVSWPGMVWGGSTNNANIKAEASKILRFYADYQNYPELALGVLGGDIRNAPPLALFPQKNVDALSSILKNFQKPEPVDVEEILADIHLNQYAHQFKSLRIIEGPRFSAINLFPLIDPSLKDGERRMELRAFYTPTNLPQVLSQYRIIQSRLGYLLSLSGEITYFRRKLDHPRTFRTKGLQEGVSLESASQSFIVYLYQAGLDPSIEARYLPNQSLQSEIQRIWTQKCLPKLHSP